MTLTAGTRLGPYEILGALGAGGMGEVYRARDLKLGRDVAIKILPDAFAADPERRSRFESEARLLAALNHPHIAAIYGIEDSPDGVRALILELVEGPTLAERIAPGPLALQESLAIAAQIAEALEAAHDRGIVHRDLKPGNIKIGDDDRVKVLDFGLAKLASGDAGSASDLTNSPTLSVVGTRAGVLLGTAAYMSPEQARGQIVDKRTDNWAFGCVLYEMLTGRAPFGGDTVTDVLAMILEREPDWGALPGGTPESARRLLRRCLQKDRKLRLRDMADAGIEMRDAQRGDPAETGRERPRSSSVGQLLLWALVLALATAMGAIGARLWRPISQPPEMRVEIGTPPTSDPLSLAISPEGRTIVFAADQGGRSRLWLRSLDAVSPRALTGTESAYFPFWSPDSRSIGFFADGKLKRIDVENGAIQVLATATAGRGGAWSADGAILFAPQAGPIYRIPAAGGERTELTTLEPKQGSKRFPQFMPDRRHFLYYVVSSTFRGLYVADSDGSNPRRILDADAAGAYAWGHLLFVRQGTLLAQRFDPERAELGGTAFPIATEVARDVGVGAAALSAAAAGPIAYRTGSGIGTRQLAWFDRSGREIRKVGTPDDAGNWGPALSPDGRSVAEDRTVDGNADVWILDAVRGALRRLTSDPANDVGPVWSADGKRIVFASNRTGTGDLYQRLATGAGGDELLLTTPFAKQVSDWSADDRFVLYRSQHPQTRYDIWAMPLQGDRKPFPVVQTGVDERDAQFSPDGKWIAYESDESGHFEIFVRPFPGPGPAWPVSTNGGAQARWGRDGRELFYVSLDEQLTAVSVQLDAARQAVEAGSPRPLFPIRIGGAVTVNKQQFAVSPAGDAFLIKSIANQPNPPPITLVLNWKGSPR